MHIKFSRRVFFKITLLNSVGLAASVVTPEISNHMIQTLPFCSLKDLYVANIFHNYCLVYNLSFL